MSLLADILKHKRGEAAELRSRQGRRPADWPIRDVVRALTRPRGTPLHLIAEVKFRSPSAGPLSTSTSAADRAAAYERAGASMVSVLTDARWFGGSHWDLERVRARLAIPLLCKDFMIDPCQVRRAWEAGADAALFILRCIPDDGLLNELFQAAHSYGLEPFVEVFEERELDRALNAGARIIGVNARDLDTLVLDAERAARILARVPSSAVAVHLSGLRTAEDASRIANTRADAALVGETLMRQDNPEPLLSAMVQAAQ